MTSITRGYRTWNWENGIIHRLDVVQDVTLAKRNNINCYIVLLVGRLTHDPLKRSLVKFENLKTSCPAHKIRFAKMYLFFWKTFTPRFISIYKKPYLKNTFQVHRVLKSWDEQQAVAWIQKTRVKMAKCTSQYRKRCRSPTTMRMFSWSTTNMLSHNTTGGFMEFDVTRAVSDWRKGKPNYGLLIKTANEKLNGRDIRFISKPWQRRSKHPFIMVECEY